MAPPPGQAIAQTWRFFYDKGNGATPVAGGATQALCDYSMQEPSST
jgi:hypothetical protein